MTPPEPTPCSITCATDKELLKMFYRTTFTDYYRSMVLGEIQKRGLPDPPANTTPLTTKQVTS